MLESSEENILRTIVFDARLIPPTRAAIGADKCTRRNTETSGAAARVVARRYGKIRALNRVVIGDDESVGSTITSDSCGKAGDVGAGSDMAVVVACVRVPVTVT